MIRLSLHAASRRRPSWVKAASFTVPVAPWECAQRRGMGRRGARGRELGRRGLSWAAKRELNLPDASTPLDRWRAPTWKVFVAASVLRSQPMTPRSVPHVATKWPAGVEGGGQGAVQKMGPAASRRVLAPKHAMAHASAPRSFASQCLTKRLTRPHHRHAAHDALVRRREHLGRRRRECALRQRPRWRLWQAHHLLEAARHIALSARPRCRAAAWGRARLLRRLLLLLRLLPRGRHPGDAADAGADRGSSCRRGRSWPLAAAVAAPEQRRSQRARGHAPERPQDLLHRQRATTAAAAAAAHSRSCSCRRRGARDGRGLLSGAVAAAAAAEAAAHKV
jgi:hypothetical protein